MCCRKVRSVVSGAISLVAVAIVLMAKPVMATSFELVWEPPQKLTGSCESAGGQGIAGSLKRLETRYDSVTHTLSWKGIFSPCNGNRLPDGFRLSMNHGENPKSAGAKELAFLYFDASHLFDGVNAVPNPANPNPILTAYVFTGADSFASGAPIASSHPDSASAPWVYSIGAHNNPDGTRTLFFDIDASVIKNFSDSDEWWGVGYDSQIGFWWHPFAGLRTSYCGGTETHPTFCAGKAGFLKEFTIENGGTSGWYDTDWMVTNKVPYCVTKIDREWPGKEENGKNPPQCISVEIGDSFDALIYGHDGNHHKLIPTYSGAPNGSGVSVEGAALLPDNTTPYPVPVEVAFSWTPALADAGGSHTVVFNFTDGGFPKVSGSGATGSCSLPLCVPHNDPPVCDLRVTTSKQGENFTCEGPETTLELSAVGSKDPEGGALKYVWDVICRDESGAEVREGIVPAGTNGELAQLSLAAPYEPGKKLTCIVELTVTDHLLQQASCETQLVVDPCPRDCLDQPLGEAKLDRCGVCDGNDACLDCAGVPFGEKVSDACDVCGGDSACLDCAGQPNGGAELDQCGVCGGDGSSCLGCADTDVINLLFELDGGALEQRNTILKTLTRLLYRDSSTRQKRFAQKVRQAAHTLYVRNWTLTWSLPQIVTQCENASLCVEVSNVETLNSYAAASAELLDLNKQVIRRLQKTAGERLRNGRRRGHKLLRTARQQHRDNLSRAALVPATESVCN